MGIPFADDKDDKDIDDGGLMTSGAGENNRFTDGEGSGLDGIRVIGG